MEKDWASSPDLLSCATPGLPRRSEHQSGGAGFQTRENALFPQLAGLPRRSEH
jgi:hypothetical protein